MQVAEAGNASNIALDQVVTVPAVDVVVAGGGPTLFDGTMYPMEADYIEVAAGSYDLEVRLDSNGALALPLDGITLMEGTRYTVYAVGLAGDSSLAAEIVADPR